MDLETFRLIASLDEGEAIGLPVHAAVLPGSSLLVTAYGDTVYAARIDGTLPVRLEVKLVPFPGARIDSFALVDGASIAAGYVLVSGRVFRFDAETDARWKAREIELPDVEPAGLFADGDVGRLVLKNGVTVSLPSLVPLSESLPAAGLVLGVTEVCGQGHVVATSGVYRQVLAPGANLATWVKLEAGLPAIGVGRLAVIERGDDRDLFLFGPHGQSVRWQYSGCTAR